MFTLTPNATEKLTEHLNQMNTTKDETYRLYPSASNPKELKLAVDKIKSDDKVFKNDEGKKILVVEPHLFSNLNAMGFDYKNEAFKIVNLQKK